MLRKDFTVLNSLLFIFLAVITSSFPFTANYELLTFTEDAKQYMAVGNGLFHTDEGFSNVRPFLYPLFLKIIYGVGGAKGAWIVQLGLWIVSANFLYFALKQYTGSRITGAIAVVFFISNVTLIALTYHALTEVLTVFLLSWLIYLLTTKNHDGFSRTFRLIAVLVALSLVKPLFLYPALVSIILGVVIYIRKFIAQPRKIVIPVLILSPLLLQYSMMQAKYGKWELSEVSDMTLRGYLVAEGYQQIEGMERAEAIEAAGNLTNKELRSRIHDHFNLYAANYLTHVKHNIAGSAVYFNLKPQWRHSGYLDYQSALNVRYLNWVKMILLLSAITITHQFFTKRLRRNLKMYIPLLLCVYIIFASGISFLQGDRLTVIALPAGIFALLMPLGYSLSIFREKISENRYNKKAIR